MQSLQQITDAWGNWKAGRLGTSCRFTASTNYGSQGDLGNYHQYQCTATYQSISYAGNSPPTNGANVAYELWYDNNSTVQQSELFQYTATATQSFTWSITESVSVGIEISATEGVPAVASASEKVSVTLSLSSTQGGTTTNSQSWMVNTPVVVPQDSSMKCDVVLNMQSYDINFSASVLVAGYVAIWFNDKVALGAPGDLHWLWFIPIGQVFGDVTSNSITNTTGYQMAAGGLLTTAQGVFTGSQGISVGVSTTQYPLRTSSAAAAFRARDKTLIYTGAVGGAENH